MCLRGTRVNTLNQDYGRGNKRRDPVQKVIETVTSELARIAEDHGRLIAEHLKGEADYQDYQPIKWSRTGEKLYGGFYRFTDRVTGGDFCGYSLQNCIAAMYDRREEFARKDG